MSVIFIILPLAVIMAGIATFAFITSVRRGQYDDLDSPPWRMLFSDDDRPGDSSAREQNSR